MNTKSKSVRYQIVDALHPMYHPTTFETEAEARAVIESEYTNSPNPYWREREQLVEKVTTIVEVLPKLKTINWIGFECSILDLMLHPAFISSDKLQAFTTKGNVDEKTLRLFAVRCARRVQSLYELEDKTILNAIDVAEMYANGEATEKGLEMAWNPAFMKMSGTSKSDGNSILWIGYVAHPDPYEAARWGAFYSRYALPKSYWQSEMDFQVEIAIDLLYQLK